MELLLKAPVLSCGAKRGGAGAGSPMGPLMGALGRWVYRAVKPPPPPRICGTPGGPPVTAPRVRLSDGRHLAYAESGVSKEEARYKVVFSHGFTGSRHDTIRPSPVSCSSPPRPLLGCSVPLQPAGSTRNQTIYQWIDCRIGGSSTLFGCSECCFLIVFRNQEFVG